jgi:type III pantothenate kinase
MEPSKMLLTVDIGNTETTVGLFHEERLQYRWRLSTSTPQTADELGVVFHGLLRNHDIDPAHITGIAIACVVPSLTQSMQTMSSQYFHCQTFVIGPDMYGKLQLAVDNPAEVGADRVANTVSVSHRYGTPAIVVDFGTATNFDVINEKGAFIGGAIAPGIALSLDALFTRAAKLSSIQLSAPDSAIGTNTVDAIRGGFVLGFAALVDGLIERTIDELHVQPSAVHIIATGGLAHLVAPQSKYIQEVDEDLTLQGIRLLYEEQADSSSDQ